MTQLGENDFIPEKSLGLDPSKEKKETEAKSIFGQLLKLHEEDMGESLKGKDFFGARPDSEEIKEVYAKLSEEQVAGLTELWINGDTAEVEKDYDPRCVGRVLSRLVNDRPEATLKTMAGLFGEKESEGYQNRTVKGMTMLFTADSGSAVENLFEEKSLNQEILYVGEVVTHRSTLEVLRLGILPKSVEDNFLAPIFSDLCAQNGSVMLNNVVGDDFPMISGLTMRVDLFTDDEDKQQKIRNQMRICKLKTEYLSYQSEYDQVNIQELEHEESGVAAGLLKILSANKPIDHTPVPARKLIEQTETPLTSTDVFYGITSVLLQGKQIDPDSYFAKELIGCQLTDLRLSMLIKHVLDLNNGSWGVNGGEFLDNWLREKLAQAELGQAEVVRICLPSIGFGVKLPEFIEHKINESRQRIVEEKTSYDSNFANLLDYSVRTEPDRWGDYDRYGLSPQGEFLRKGLSIFPASFREAILEKSEDSDYATGCTKGIFDIVFEKYADRIRQTFKTGKEIDKVNWPEEVNADVWQLLQNSSTNSVLYHFERLSDSVVRIENGQVVIRGSPYDTSEGNKHVVKLNQVIPKFLTDRWFDRLEENAGLNSWTVELYDKAIKVLGPECLAGLSPAKQKILEICRDHSEATKPTEEMMNMLFKLSERAEKYFEVNERGVEFTKDGFEKLLLLHVRSEKEAGKNLLWLTQRGLLNLKQESSLGSDQLDLAYFLIQYSERLGDKVGDLYTTEGEKWQKVLSYKEFRRFIETTVVQDSEGISRRVFKAKWELFEDLSRDARTYSGVLDGFVRVGLLDINSTCKTLLDRATKDGHFLSTKEKNGLLMLARASESDKLIVPLTVAQSLGKKGEVLSAIGEHYNDKVFDDPKARENLVKLLNESSSDSFVAWLLNNKPEIFADDETVKLILNFRTEFGHIPFDLRLLYMRLMDPVVSTSGDYADLQKELEFGKFDIDSVLGMFNLLQAQGFVLSSEHFKALTSLAWSSDKGKSSIPVFMARYKGFSEAGIEKIKILSTGEKFENPIARMHWIKYLSSIRQEQEQIVLYIVEKNPDFFSSSMFDTAFDFAAIYLGNESNFEFFRKISKIYEKDNDLFHEVSDSIQNGKLSREVAEIFYGQATSLLGKDLQLVRKYVLDNADILLVDKSDIAFINNIVGLYGKKADILLSGYKDCLAAGVITKQERGLILDFVKEFKVVSPTIIAGYKEAKLGGHDLAYIAQLKSITERLVGSGNISEQERKGPYYNDLLRHVYTNNAHSWGGFEKTELCIDRTADLARFVIKPRYEIDLLSQSLIKVKEGQVLDQAIIERVQSPILGVAGEMKGLGYDKQKIEIALAKKLGDILKEIVGKGGLRDIDLKLVEHDEEKLFLIVSDAIYGTRSISPEVVKNLFIYYEFAKFEDISDYVNGTTDRVSRASNRDYALLCEVGAFYTDRIKEVNRRLVRSAWANPVIKELMPKYFHNLAQETSTDKWKNRVNKMQVEKLGETDMFVDRLRKVLEKDKSRKYTPEQVKKLIRRYESWTEGLAEERSGSSKERTRAFYGQLRSQREKTIEALKVITGEEVDPKQIHLGEINLAEALAAEKNIKEAKYDEEQFASFTAQRFIDIFENERDDIDGELAKFQSASGKDREVLFGYISKTKETANARMVGGVCVSRDNPQQGKEKNIWDMPNYLQMVFQDPETLQCQGLVLLHYFEEGGKKILSASFNPSQTYLYTVDETALFKGIRGSLEDFAKENGMDMVVVSQNKTIRTNRTGGVFEKEMDKQVQVIGKKYEFESAKDFSFEPSYKIKEMDVIWERE